jgi:hypothetical protein
MNFWQGRQGAKDLYEGIRHCNIFMENIDRVPDMTNAEKEKWKGEVLFLKAYYHFYLLRMFGPIPLIKGNVPVTADFGDVYPTRNTVDDCFAYVVELLDEAIKRLPAQVSMNQEYGRITQPIAYCQKAIVLVEAASPLFNGNADFAGFQNILAEELFDKEEKIEKWQKAAKACEIAVKVCDSLKYKLYTFPVGQYQITTDAIKTQMSLRCAVTEKDMLLNSEVIWGNTNSYCGELQRLCIPRGLRGSGATYYGLMAPTLKIAEMFYTDHGVPIDEDSEYQDLDWWALGVGDAKHNRYIREGYSTVNLHFHREPRFYAALGFDGGYWFGGIANPTDNAPADDDGTVMAKKGQKCAAQNEIRYSVTGYWAKKLVNHEMMIGSSDIQLDQGRYAWPEIRLANIFLLYAEALNEANHGPTPEAFYYIDQVRARAGLDGVQASWAYSTKPTGYCETYDGFQQIVRRERLIELVFEGQRYWDLRRWKDAVTVLNEPIIGWDLERTDAESYYRRKTIFFQRFDAPRDYFWPVPETELLSNKNLNQLPGW